MMTLYDIVAPREGPPPAEAIGARLGLSAQLVERGMRALLPAFTTAMARAAETPDGARQLLTAMGGRDTADMVERATAAMPESVKSEGREILAEVFGSERVQRAVAAQAAAQSGVAEAVMLEMMPAVAARIAAGFARLQAENPLLGFWAGTPPAEAPAPRNGAEPARDLVRELFESGLQTQSAQMQAFVDLFDRLWGGADPPRTP